MVELDLEGYDFSVTGFQRTDLEDLIQQLDIPPEATEDGYDAEAAAAEIEVPETRPGDLWKLGRHRLLCGDTTDPEDIERLLSGRQLDLVITDPPYNVNYGEKVDFLKKFRTDNCRQESTIENDLMSETGFYDFLLASFRNINGAMRPGAAIYVFHADNNGLPFRQAYTDAGLKLAQVLIWEKSNFVLGRQDYQWRHEPIMYGWKEGAAHYFINDRTQDTILLEDETDFKAMSKKKDEFGQPIIVRPGKIIVPAGLDFDIYTLFNSPTIHTSGNTQAVNPLYQYRDLQIIADPTINALAGGFGNVMPWWMTANTTDSGFIEVDYLNGQEVPTIRRMETPGQLGFVWDIYLDWGSLDTLIFRLCFILGCPFRKAICFVLPFGVPRKEDGFVRVLDGNFSKTFSWRLRWTRLQIGIWCSLARRSPAGSCRPHINEGGVAESR